LTRQRKVREPCPICTASRTLCLCDAVPRIELKTKIALVIHHRELSRNSNTGLLALRALVNSEVRIRGEGREALDLQDLLSPQYRTFLFFPCADAVELDRTLVTQDRRPIQLIVPDGTWRQAKKILSRQPELKELPRVKISTPNQSTFQLRAQSRPERMATLQAIAQGLGVIEGDPVRAQLMKLYGTKIERTLIGRGILREKPALGQAGWDE
jgi:DTW domain-containing protein